MRRRNGDGRRYGWARTFAPALVCILAASLAAAPGGGVKEIKRFSVTVSPSSVAAGSTPTFSITLRNDASSNTTLGSANVTIPTAFTYVPGSLVAPAGWTTSSVSGNVLGLRSSASSDKIAPGGFRTFTIRATVGCATAQTWQPVLAKQSNDFSGTGNDFTRVGDLPVTQIIPGNVASIDLADIATQKAGQAFTASVSAFDSCGNLVPDFVGPVQLSGLADNPTPTPDATPDYGTFSFSGGIGTASVTAVQPAYPATLTATSGTFTDSESFDVGPGPATELRVDPIPDAYPAVAGTQQLVNQAFAVHVTTLDRFGDTGAPVSVATTVALTANPSFLSGATSVTIPADGTSGASFTPSYTATRNGVVLTASGGALISGVSNSFDVLDVVVTADATPGHITDLSSLCTDTTPENPTCITAHLANGATGTVTLIEGSCNGLSAFSSGCVGSLGGLFGSFKDSDGTTPLYTFDRPARVIVEYDKSIAGNQGVTKIQLYVSLDEGDPYVVAPACVQHDIVNHGPGDPAFCVDNRNRQGDGDTELELIFYHDIRFGGR
jgi:hypothetical protein